MAVGLRVVSVVVLVATIVVARRFTVARRPEGTADSTAQAKPGIRVG
jgi:hypothetical protein